MSDRNDLRNERIVWLTRAVRALMKIEFSGETPGSPMYEQMEVGKQDLALKKREDAYTIADKQFAAFIKEPSDEEALKKLSVMFPDKESE